MWRAPVSSTLYVQLSTGKPISASSTSGPLTGANAVLALRSDTSVHNPAVLRYAPVLVLMKLPAPMVGVISPFTAPNQKPPAALAMKVLSAGEFVGPQPKQD